MKKIFALALALVLLSGLCALPVSAAVPKGYAADVLRLANEERAKKKLPPVKGSHAKLSEAAQTRAEEIAVDFNSSHTRPDGSKFFTVLDELGVDYTRTAENIAMGYATASGVMDAFMKSSGHRDNILGPFTHLSVGVYEKDGYIYCAQLFINDGTYSAAKTSKWASWHPALQWMLKWLAFGWIWM